ncbi:MAG: T9SS C-terminal target domain-containing protein [Calditrichaeota bacterium]|nr:MAG: T9SS C-terminal target domain-containing protein [Calditrichota bacterium]
MLVLWINSLDENHLITHVYELAESPFAKSLYANAQVQPGWSLWMLPFTAQNENADCHYQLNLGGMAGKIQISAPAILNFGKKYRTYELPVISPSLEYEGHEENAAWREQALQRIEEFRKGELTVSVRNALGEPIMGAEVKVTMLQHHFGFGTAVTVSPWLQPSVDGDIYLNKLMDLDGQGHSFNVAVLENALKWPVWEDDTRHGDREQAVQIIKWLHDQHYRVRGHNLIWPNWISMPPDMKQNAADVSYLENRIHDHFNDLLGYRGIRGQLADWDVLNEPVSSRDLEKAFGTDSMYAQWFKWAHEADDGARLYITENEMLAQAGMDSLALDRLLRIIRQIDQAGAPLHGIGVQGHMKYGLTPPARLLQIFDSIAALGKEVSITEYDAVNINDDLAADYMRDILIAAFSHPSVRDFIMWGFWDGAHWQNDAPLFNRDWSLKPSGQVFFDYVFNRWWSQENGASNRQGVFSPRVYYGEYQVSATVGDHSAQKSFSFNRQQKSISLVLDTDMTAPNPPQNLVLLQNHPNPFGGMTKIRYGLPIRDKVNIELYNVLGQFIIPLIDAEQAAGWHEIVFDAADLPPGVYLYRSTSAGITCTRKMLLIK